MHSEQTGAPGGMPGLPAFRWWRKRSQSFLRFIAFFSTLHVTKRPKSNKNNTQKSTSNWAEEFTQSVHKQRTTGHCRIRVFCEQAVESNLVFPHLVKIWHLMNILSHPRQSPLLTMYYFPRFSQFPFSKNPLSVKEIFLLTEVLNQCICSWNKNRYSHFLCKQIQWITSFLHLTPLSFLIAQVFATCTCPSHFPLNSWKYSLIPLNTNLLL